MNKGWFPITWTNIVKRVTQLFHSNLNYLVEVGTIDFDDFNSAYADGIEELTFVFMSTKPLNTMFLKPVFIVEESIVSYSGVTVTSITATEEFTFATANDKSPNDKETHISVVVSLSGENAMDWTGGKVKVYILVSPYKI